MEKAKTTVKDKLQELGYFKHVNPKEIVSLIEKTFEGYKDNGEIKFPWEGLNRIFGIDAESIYERNGIKTQIESILPLLKGMNIDLAIGEYIEQFDSDSATYTKRTIELNGKLYDASGSSDWGTAFNSGLKMIDEILETFNIEERVFGLFMDESSIMIILNDEQFEYLTALIPEGSTYRPIDIKKMMN